MLSNRGTVMVSRVAAGVVSGLLALAAGPASAQVKIEKKSDPAETAKNLEAEIAKLRTMEEALHARLKMHAEMKRLDALDRVEKSRIERQIEDVKKQAEAERQRARAEFERATRSRNEELKRAEIEFDRAARLQEHPRKLAEEIEKVQRNSKLQDERARPTQREFDRFIELKTGQDKPKVVTLEVELKDQDKPRVLVLSSGDKQPVPYEKMSPQELKQVIVKLQVLLDEKMRNEKIKALGEKVKPAYPSKPGGEKVKPLGEKVKPGAVSQDEILKRLDKLSYEIEEIKRSIKK